MTSLAHLLRPAVQAELDAAAAAEAQGRFTTAFSHLERAHVLGQGATILHLLVHWRMLAFAVRARRPGDCYGQAWRLLAAALFTALGLVPRGNTGGTGVSGFRPLPVPADLQATLDRARASRPARRRRLPATIAFAALAALATLGMGACSTPADLDLSLDKPSAGGAYRVALVPPPQPPAINQLHGWQVRLLAADGRPVHGATFAVGGGMPQHGHGLPTQPRVTRELADGLYQLDGMKFSMTGWWEIQLAIQGPQGADRVTFNTMVDDPRSRP
ncbi:MAG: DUF3703 domain-containing protein [Comamonadaceae bacterium]|nr:MAG: DUF3703 domain-containing protein [Comamonadaceae bacterium]